MKTIPHEDELRSRWRLEGTIPLSGVAEDAAWVRARSIATGDRVVLFIVHGSTALETADAARRAFLVEDPRLIPVREVLVLDDPRDADTVARPVRADGDAPAEPAAGAGSGAPTTVVEYPMPSAPPLAALLADGPLRPETARSVIGEAARGIETARRRGLRHQFLDSNRVFVDVDANAVTVLGVGVEAAAHEGLDRSGPVASFQDATALVALLYRGLTGKSPRRGADGEVPRASTVSSRTVPADLDALCDLILNDSADAVPETSRALIADLEPWQSIPVTLQAFDPDDARLAAQERAESSAAGTGDEDEDAGPATQAMDPVADEPTQAMQTVGEPTQSMPRVGDQSDLTEPSVTGDAAPAAGSASDAAEARTAAEANALVTDLHLDEKRTSSPFPGHLDITLPRAPRTPGPEAAVAAGAAGAASPLASAPGSFAPGPHLVSTGSEAPAPIAPGHPAAADPAGGALAPAAPTPAAPSARAAAHAPARREQAPFDQELLDGPGTASPPPTSGPVPVLVRGRQQPVAPENGPIIVRGRERSELDAAPIESTLPSGTAAALLRDVVSVATDSDPDGATFAMGPQQPEERSRQAQWILLGAALLVILAMVFALTSITSGLRERVENPLDTTPATSIPSDMPSNDGPAKPEPKPTGAPAVAPQLAKAQLIGGGGGGADHPEAESRLADGDPGSVWSSQMYSTPQYGGLKDGMGVRLDLAEKAKVTAVVVTTARNQGGAMELRAVGADGAPGAVLASAPFAGDGEVRLEPEKPVEAERVAVWISQLPSDSDKPGRFRARIAEIRVE